MNNKLQAVLNQIDEQLLKGYITKFKIGKTGDVDERFAANDYDDYALVSIIAHSDDTKKVDTAEKDLIDYYKNHKGLKDKCENKNLGGGNPGATSVYIIAKSSKADYLDRMIGKEPLMDNDFITIEL